jgi:GNAT superfamily N-acetyltransferase
MGHYVRAIAMSNATIEICDARIPADLSLVRCLFREYAAALGVDLCFQGFETELAGLPGRYARPQGGIWLAMNNGVPAGCVALRPIDQTAAEMKRLYVRPDNRGQGLGQLLIQQVVAAAKDAGYQRLCLDTLPSMAGAIRLYQQLGFTPIEPYCHNPVPGAMFFGFELSGD